LKIDDALVEGNGEVDTGSRIISISNFQAGAGLIEFKACNFAAGEHTFWIGFDGDGDGNFEGVADSTTEVTFTVEVLQESGYEKVLTLASNGTVTEGNWDDFYNQVVNEGNDCKVRFDGRVIAPIHIEYTSSSVTFDFAPLHAYHNGWDSYAYIDLQKGVRAGIGAAYRRGHDDVVWMKDRDQHPEAEWHPFDVEVFCKRENPYRKVASFAADGTATMGSFDAARDLAVNGAASCKLRYDNRLSPALHLEYDTENLYFDFVSLAAIHNTWDAYAYINVRKNVRAGIGASYRRGHDDVVWMKDRDQHPEAEWHAMGVDLFCTEAYDKVLSIDANGEVLEGSWEDFRNRALYEGRACKIRFDQRVAIPSYIEYDEGDVRFDFQNLSAYHNGWEAFAYIDVEKGVRAGIGATYRRGHDDVVYLPTFEQHPESEWHAMPLDLFCEPDIDDTFGGYQGSGVIAFSGAISGSGWSQFHDLVAGQTADCKLRFDGRILLPELIEFSDLSFHFDAVSLVATHDTWDSYALFLVEKETRAGIGSCYRRGHDNIVWMKDRAQHDHTPWPDEFVAKSADLLCR
ncbi:MAG: hypothetical protein D6795_04185, partial [Deltaproteobacteria bacterium]